jgi:hypothetical protein
MFSYFIAAITSPFRREPKARINVIFYVLPPHAVEEILKLADESRNTENLHAEWAFWAAISRVIPEVAEHPLYPWTFSVSSALVYTVSAEIPMDEETIREVDEITLSALEKNS